MEVYVAFIETVDGQENFVLTMNVDVYPSYKTNDVVFLEIKNRLADEKCLRTTKFWISDIHHSVREVVNQLSPKDTIGLNYKHSLVMEIYVKRME